MFDASCHCGAVAIGVPARPRQLTSCNCSLCRRLGVLWAYYRADRVVFRARRGATRAYAWGAKRLAFHACRTCGCTTHWEAVDKATASRVGVNARPLDPAVLEGIRVRRLDGARTWRYLD